jgi:hypothetical protein
MVVAPTIQVVDGSLVEEVALEAQAAEEVLEAEALVVLEAEASVGVVPVEVGKKKKRLSGKGSLFFLFPLFSFGSFKFGFIEFSFFQFILPCKDFT